MQCVEENKNTVSEDACFSPPDYTILGNGVPSRNTHFSYLHDVQRTQLVKRKFIFLKSLPLTK